MYRMLSVLIAVVYFPVASVGLVLTSQYREEFPKVDPLEEVNLSSPQLHKVIKNNWTCQADKSVKKAFATVKSIDECAKVVAMDSECSGRFIYCENSEACQCLRSKAPESWDCAAATEKSCSLSYVLYWAAEKVLKEAYPGLIIPESADDVWADEHLGVPEEWNPPAALTKAEDDVLADKNMELPDGLHNSSTTVMAAGTATMRAATAVRKKPHILFILIDDLGFADVGFNRPSSMFGYPTPSIDKLANDGVILNRHYVHKFCSPTRSAIQSGRSPIHVNVQNEVGTHHNADDPVAGFAGIPTKMTGIAQVLRGAGYKTHLVGKWDAGWSTDAQLPAAKGYDTSLTYFSHANDCWTHLVDSPMCDEPKVDLWEHDETIAYPGRPATRLTNAADCSFKNQDGAGTCKYEDALFEERVTTIIQAHDQSKPLFVFWATHAVHGPYQPPNASITKAHEFLSTQEDDEFKQWLYSRMKYYSVLSFIDDAVGRVTTALEDSGMYSDTLIVFSSDNGAVGGMDNRPLKGVKFSNWEGGIRVCAFVSGGFLPSAARGSKRDGLIAGWDWYATFAELAGVDFEDKQAAAAGLPAVDSVSVWKYVAGVATDSPRTGITVGTTVGGYNSQARREGKPMIGGFLQTINGHVFKVIFGEAPGDKAECSVFSGLGSTDFDFGGGVNSEKEEVVANFQNQSLKFKGENVWRSRRDMLFNPDTPMHDAVDEACYSKTQTCGSTPETGCLFDVTADEQEKVNLASSRSDVFKDMMQLIKNRESGVFAPDRGALDDSACPILKQSFQDTLGPWFLSSHGSPPPPELSLNQIRRQGVL